MEASAPSPHSPSMAAAADDNAAVLPRVLIVSRRTVRKNKFVDFVGEYHLDLIVAYGAAPVIVPRVAGVRSLLPSFEPIHGVLLCEGEDIDPSLYDPSACDLSPEEIEEVGLRHRADSAGDSEKDSIELGLARLCLDRDVPFLGICRGAQVLNVAAGGTLYRDVETQLGGCVAHIDYGNYDGHRHKVRVVEESPIHEWFGELEITVNSYHHQGVRRLGQGLLPMALAEDGLAEGFYDPDRYDPESGRFVVGLQFYPERMRRAGSEEFDHPGCPKAYQEFVKAVIAYQKKVSGCVTSPTSGLKLNQEMEKKRKIIVRSFSTAKNMHVARLGMPALKESELEAGAEFLELSSVLSSQQEKRLKQMGATVRNSSAYVERVKMNEEREAAARSLMGNMSIEQLSELLYFYHLMGLTCKEVLERKLMSSVER